MTALLLALAFGAAAAQPFPQSLDLDAALALFRAQGFDLLLAEAEVSGSAGDARAARAWTNPQVMGSVSHAGRPYRASLCPPGQCSTTGFMINVSDQAGILDVLAGKHGLRSRAAAKLAAAAQHNLNDVQRLLEAQVKGQYVALALDQAQVAFMRTVTETFERGQALFRDRYREGDISEADLTRVEVEALESAQRQDQALAQLEDDRFELARLLGHRGAIPPFEVTAPWLKEGQVGAYLTLPMEHFVAVAEAHRPDLQALMRAWESTSAALSLAKRTRLPDVALAFNYQQFGTGQNAVQPRTYTGSLTLALPILYQQQGEIRRAAANAEMARLRVERGRALVGSDVRRAVTALKYAWQRSQRSKEALTTRASRARELVQLQYTKGAASLLDLLDAQRTYSSVHQEYLGTLGDYWNAVIGLEQAMATEVRL